MSKVLPNDSKRNLKLCSSRVSSHILCALAGPRQVANNLIIMPSKNELVNKNTNKVNNNFLFKVISISLLSMN